MAIPCALLAAIAWVQPAQAFLLFSGYDENTTAGTVLPTHERSNSNGAADALSLLLAPGSVTTEGFEGLPTSQAIDGLLANISGVGTTLSYKKNDGSSATGGGTTRVQAADASGMTNSGTFPTEGLKGISINSSNNFEILLDEAIAAFSFWGTDLGDKNNGLTIELYKDLNLLASQPIDYLGANSGDSSVFFFGSLAETPSEYFNRIVFNNSRSGDAIGLDQFTIAAPSQVVSSAAASSSTPVPTPALLPGLLGMVVRLWQRQRSVTTSEAA